MEHIISSLYKISKVAYLLNRQVEEEQKMCSFQSIVKDIITL